MTIGKLIGLGCAAVMLAAASAPDLKSFMTVEVDPAANAFWASGNDAPEGETPGAEARWTAAGQAAAKLSEHGRRLLQPPYRRRGEWESFARLMIEAGEAGEAATRQRSLDAAFDAGGKLYDACNGCHTKYVPGRG